MVVDVAQGIQPVIFQGADPAGVIDLQPGPRGEADGFQADVVGQGQPAGGEQHLVGLQFVAAFERQGDGAGAARAEHRGDGGTETHVRSGLGQGTADQLPGEGLHPGQQAGPGAGHFHPDSAAPDDG